MMKGLFLLLFTGWCYAETIAHTEVEVQGHRVSAEEVVVGVTLSPEENWHTYWSNPGDAGMTPSLSLDAETLEVEALELPAPKRYELAGLVAYGYGKPVTFLFKISGAIEGELSGSVRWLVCDDAACVPGNKEFSLKLSEGDLPSWYEDALELFPKPLKISGAETFALKDDSGWGFSFSSEVDLAGWTVFPYDGNLAELERDPVLTEKEGRYHFSFDSIGDPPSGSRFLLSQGDQAYTVTF